MASSQQRDRSGSASRVSRSITEVRWQGSNPTVECNGNSFRIDNLVLVLAAVILAVLARSVLLIQTVLMPSRPPSRLPRDTHVL